jgi:hypothetical protein
MNIQLPTGKTLSVSTYEYLFVLKEEDVDLFFQACIADDLGQEINHPFSNKASKGKLDFEEPSMEHGSGDDFSED